jgi:NAD(P)-dependent dehydrogenase (short-subunit alcohol dehydrogenase family)
MAAFPFPVPLGSFAGRAVLMTQHDGGLDSALAAAFIALGARVAVIGAASPGIAGLAPPALDDVGADAQIDAAATALGLPIDILVNNRWCKPLAPAESAGWVAWQAVTAALVDSAVLVTTAFARRRLASGGSGVVLNFIDSSASGGGPLVAATAAAHAALENLTRSWAVEWAADDIRVNALSCGLIQERAEPAFAIAARRGVDPASAVPMARIGTAADIVPTALYLCSRYAAYVTGATFTIDGAEGLRHTLGGATFVAPRLR